MTSGRRPWRQGSGLPAIGMPVWCGRPLAVCLCRWAGWIDVRWRKGELPAELPAPAPAARWRGRRRREFRTLSLAGPRQWWVVNPVARLDALTLLCPG